jgi:hypothetical protein
MKEGEELNVIWELDPGEILEVFEVRSALEVALVKRENEAEAIPDRIVKSDLLYEIQKADQLAQGEGRRDVCWGSVNSD